MSCWQVLAQWAEERDVARELLSQHTSWLEAMRVSIAATKAPARDTRDRERERHMGTKSRRRR